MVQFANGCGTGVFGIVVDLRLLTLKPKWCTVNSQKIWHNSQSTRIRKSVAQSVPRRLLAITLFRAATTSVAENL
ncbi:hypothetical protein IQ250_18745 [Pseudanabaenaceae cyanobacterium LEGE 13415]|nr:hypothetical protein [Pseudanabaenaceae cyanobacterium LEGE 13415]